jgi:hypothetical protein
MSIGPALERQRGEGGHMEYLLLIYTDETYWPRMSPAEQEKGAAAYGAYAQALQKAGVFRGANRLKPTSAATRVRVSDDKLQVLDGPYAESKEQLGGYFLIEAPDLDSAITWAGRCPGATHGVMEVRPVWPS